LPVPFLRWRIGYFGRNTKETPRQRGMEPHKPLNKLQALLGLCLAGGVALCLAGCGDSARNTAAYHPPAIQATVEPSNPPVKTHHNPPAKTHPNPPAKSQPNPPAKTQSSLQVKAAPRIGA